MDLTVMVVTAILGGWTSLAFNGRSFVFRCFSALVAGIVFNTIVMAARVY